MGEKDKALPHGKEKFKEEIKFRNENEILFLVCLNLQA